jgi:hypothetical protein
VVEVITALAGLLVLGMAFLGGVILVSEADEQVTAPQAKPEGVSLVRDRN